MDWTKLIDRFFGFLCGLIPGSVVVAVAALHRPDVWSDFWKLANFGYQTKVAVLVGIAFVTRTSVNSFLGALVGGISSGLAAYKAEKRAQALRKSGGSAEAAAPPEPTQVAYWRDLTWRKLVAAYLGDAAPEDLQPFADEAEFNQALEIANGLPQPDKARELSLIARRNSPARMQQNDALWQACWNRLHAVTARPSNSTMAMALTLVSAYGGASLIALLAAPWTPELRRWWILVPCVYYVLMMAVEGFTVHTQGRDAGLLFEQQWQYLRTHVAKGEQPGEKG